jgi:apolipoprotein N-acyltransferase
LVPFGEHVPYASLFFFAGKLLSEVGDFVPGQRYQLLPGVNGSRVAAVICYEVAFPELVRQLTSRGANVIVNVSNDGWFGDSPARRQNLLMARMRAIENDRWLLRATNDGLTAVISPQGRVETYPAAVREVFAARYGLKSSQTFYTTWGDWFALLCVALAAGRIAQVLVPALSEPSPVGDGSRT